MDNIKKDLEYFENLEYDITIKKNKSLFILYIHELCLLVEDEDLNEAHKKLELEKEKYFQKMVENGYQGNIREPKKIEGRKSFSWNLLPFFVKLIITFSIIAIFLTIYNIKTNTFRYVKKVSKNFSKVDFSQATKDVVQATNGVTQAAYVLAKATNDIAQATRDTSQAPKDIALASKDIAQASKDIAQSLTLNIEQTVYKIVNTFDKHRKAKEERELIAKYKPIPLVYKYASNSTQQNPVKYAFDSDPSTFWHSSENKADVTVRVKQPTMLKAFSFSYRPDSREQSPEIIIIEGSNDNKNWEYIDKKTQLDYWKLLETKMIFTEGNNKYYLYYRFRCIKKRKDSYLSFVEFKLFGK